MTEVHKFAAESNAIEREWHVSDNQVEALEWFLEQPLNEKSILEYHRRVAEGLPKKEIKTSISHWGDRTYKHFQFKEKDTKLSKDLRKGWLRRSSLFCSRSKAYKKEI